jgi:hypothetical protein
MAWAVPGTSCWLKKHSPIDYTAATVTRVCDGTSV